MLLFPEANAEGGEQVNSRSGEQESRGEVNKKMAELEDATAKLEV